MPVLYFISSFEGAILLLKNYKVKLQVFFLFLLHQLLQQKKIFFNLKSEKHWNGMEFIKILLKWN